MSKKKMSVNKIANIIQTDLLKSGFVIQRYDAYKTKSIYLKLDYGVANSVRIADHGGKQYLHYRYNIGPHIKQYRETTNGYPQYFYPVCEIQRLINDIKHAKQVKLGLYGQSNYNYTMEKYLTDGLTKKGFWQQARLVTLPENKEKSNT